MKALGEAHKAGGAVITLDRLAPALEARTKGTVERALALAAKLSHESNDPDTSRLSSVVARALAHESPDVQTAALKLMGPNPAMVTPYVDLLAPSVRADYDGNEPGVANTDPLVAPSTPGRAASVADFLVWRLWCASEQAASRIKQPLLSLPTSPDGCIDPREFEARLTALTDHQRRAAENDRDSPFHLDFLLARLRARGGAVPERMLIVWKKRTWEAGGRTYSYHYPVLEVKDLRNPSRFDPAGLTTAHFSATLEMKRWCATVNPHWSEGWFAAGCRDLGGNLDCWHADWSTRAYLEPLLDSSIHLGDMGALLIALGIGAKEAGERGLATDALLAAISGTRLDAAAFGRALSDATASGAIKFSRWAKQLYTVAQAGAAAADAVFRAVEALFETGCGTENGDFGRIVELEYELAHLTGLKLRTPGSLRTLAALNVGGKTGRAASELLKSASAPD